MTAKIVRNNKTYNFKGTQEKFHIWIKELEEKLKLEKSYDK